MADLARDALNRVSYSGLDFPTAEDEILTRIQVNFASTYNDFAVSSLGIMIIDLFAFGIDGMSFYLDRRATDLYLTTARTTKSVARAARQLGYKMAPATASSVDITVAPVITQTFLTPLPLGFQVQSPDGSIWEATQAYTWPINNNDPQVITFSQTNTLQSIFTSDGTHNQVFKISNVPTDEFIVGPGTDGVSQVTVTINGVDWVEEELLLFGQTNEFEIGYQDTPPTLRLGDGIAGNIPPAGAQVRLTYKSSRGTAGSVTANQIMTPVRALTVNFTSINLTLTLPTGSSGGSDPETIQKAQANAPTFFKSRGVNVTQEDYNVRAGTFVDSVYGAIAVANAVSVSGSSSDAQLQSYVDEITATSGDYVTTVGTAVTSADATLVSASAEIAAATTDVTAIAADLSTIATQSAALVTTSQEALTAASLATVFLAQIVANTTTLNTTISGITTGGSDQLTTGTASALSALITAIQASTSNANAQTSTINSDLGTMAAAIGTIGTSSADSSTQQSLIAAQLTETSSDITTATTTLNALVTAVGNIDANIGTLGQDILDHVDSFLSSDCQSNLIEIPVLAFDSDGFYTAPTIALTQSLQAYLDANKEITQVVKVVSGANLLIPVDITVNAEILTGYVEATITSQIEAAVITVLKQRPFGKNLKLSELYWVLDPDNNNIAGLSSVDVTITGPTANLDGNGNIDINESQVVTLGVITVTDVVIQS